VLVFNVLGVSGFGDEKVPTTANPEWEQPLADLVETWQLKLDELITHRYRIDEAPQAFADLESGRNARGVIVF